ncbi:HPr kinase/phosphorylase [Paraurantiacibacter namhicola]|uniref:HPr kinase/phosphorylase n=1 Tax=Paraurantiacibacter namhicola TaxID=645517 RepID=A0A1C7D7P8_9SPHN|nr:HPr kinase/phosphatase C-terminal domain-containing protein [Paraurantiacibacter namhicola]ANU07478.1 HPr kinase/phosphorylase [Paraurantiacibacter namhicola]
MSALLANVTCVSIEGRGLLIEGAPGSGKSSLALALIDRGAVLVGDDGVTVDAENGALLASPPPNIAGKLEIRNVGIIEMPVTQAPVSLVVTLQDDAPRLPDGAGMRRLQGVEIPHIALFAATPHLPLRAEWALRMHGLP